MGFNHTCISVSFAFCSISVTALAQDYPSKSIRLLVPSTAGGPTDIVARMLSEKLSLRLDRPVVVDNRGGANGIIAMDIIAKAPPDGYTIVLGAAGAWAVNQHLYPLTFDVMRDFAPIAVVSTSLGVLVVHPSVAANTVPDLIALAKKNPGALNYGSSGVGGFGHISGELFTRATQTQITHVPYKSAAPALSDLISGQVQVLFNNTFPTIPHIKAKRVRALATTGARRSRALPGLPTVAESGVPGYENTSWTAMAAPKGTPKSIIVRLHTDLTAVLAEPDVQKRFADAGAEIIGSTPEQFRALP